MNKRDIIALGLLSLLPLLHGCFGAAVVGAGAAVAVAEDRRTTGIYVEDGNIELKVSKALGQRFGENDAVHVNTTSYNRYVLLTGEVPDAATKTEAGVLALGVENVRNVQNELAVGPVTSFNQRATDGYLTSLVKSRFIADNKVQANRVKVVTDNNVVFLMGLVTRQEADDATEIARTTSGVAKVVRVFEFID